MRHGEVVGILSLEYRAWSCPIWEESGTPLRREASDIVRVYAWKSPNKSIEIHFWIVPERCGYQIVQMRIVISDAQSTPRRGTSWIALQRKELG
jgi:hypothetical protein